MLSTGMFSARALCTARRRRKLVSGSPPPSFAATMISRVSLVKSCPRFASAAPFLRLIVDHLLCPDMVTPLYLVRKIHVKHYRKLYQRPPESGNARLPVLVSHGRRPDTHL